MAVISCPFATQDAAGEDVIAGSLGDALDIICPVVIRMKDARGEIVGISSSRILAEKFKLPISTSNPLDKEGPEPPPDSVEVAEPACPDRIKLDILDPSKQPCFVTMPRVFPFTPGYSVATNPPLAITTNPTLQGVDPTTILHAWYETIRYGCLNLENYSIHKKDTLFVYEGLEKSEFIANRNLASRCTVGVEFPRYDEPLYTEIINVMKERRGKRNLWN